jgi:ketopantoate reductase
VLARRPNEIATLNGGIVQPGRRRNVPTPLIETVVALISGLEHGWIV